MKVVHKAATEL